MSLRISKITGGMTSYKLAGKMGGSRRRGVMPELLQGESVRLQENWEMIFSSPPESERRNVLTTSLLCNVVK